MERLHPFVGVQIMQISETKRRGAGWLLRLPLFAAGAATTTAGGVAARTPAPTSAPTAGARITGSVACLQRLALPPGAVIKVQLVGVSPADAPGVVLGEQIIGAEGRQSPFAFAIAYDAARIEPSMSCAVVARIEEGGRLLFVDDRRYAVLTRGAPAHVDMVLRAAGANRP